MTDPIRDAFESWSVNYDYAVNSPWEIWQAAYAAGAASAGKDGERFRVAIAREDNAETLYAAVMNHGQDAAAIRREFDAAIEQEKGK